MMLDQLLEERELFIAHEAAQAVAHGMLAQAWAKFEGMPDFLRHAVMAGVAVSACHLVHQMRERGRL